MEGILDKPINFSTPRRKALQETMSDDLEKMKLSVLKQILMEHHIEFDEGIENYEQLSQHLKNTLSGKEYQDIAIEERQAREELTAFFKEMQSAGPITLKRIVNAVNEKILKPTAKSVALLGMSRMMFDALLFIPSPARTIVGVASLGAKIYRDNRGKLAQKRQEVEKRYDSLLDKLQTVTDENGNVIGKSFSTRETEIIKEFLDRNNIQVRSGLHEDLMAGVHKLKGKEKLELIKKINGEKDNKIDINAELATERIKFDIKEFSKTIFDNAKFLGIGILLSSLDKEVISLVTPFLPTSLKESIYKNRTMYANKKMGMPIGLLTSFAIATVGNVIKGTAEIISEFKRNKQNLGGRIPSEREKIVFETVKLNLLREHPESAEAIGKISTLEELQKYIRGLPADQQKNQINQMEALKNNLNRKTGKEKAKESGKILADAGILAGNSILAYQILLMINNRLHLRGKNNSQQEQQRQPQEQEQEQFETVKEMEPESKSIMTGNPQPEVVKPKVINTGEAPVPIPSPAQAPSPVPTPAPTPQLVQTSTPQSVPTPVKLEPPTISDSQSVTGVTPQMSPAENSYGDIPTLPPTKPLSPEESMEINKKFGKIAKYAIGIIGATAAMGVSYFNPNLGLMLQEKAIELGGLVPGL